MRGGEPELVSAFGNLVANAVRYTPPGGTVRISWHANAQGAEFAVQDSGIGIDPKHIPRLTERFYRVDRGRSRDAGGTGLEQDLRTKPPANRNAKVGSFLPTARTYLIPRAIRSIVGTIT